jgi:large subunit ribosomal protein L25
MAQTELKVTLRERVGKGGSRSLRRQELLPAVVYGKGMEPCAITVDPKQLEKAIDTESGWNTLITLKGEGVFDGKIVILKDMNLDPIRRDPVHADFQAIDINQRVHVMVPVHPVGKSAGEKLGGNLQVIRHELEVTCLPTAIPDAIEVDVTAMKIGDVLHVEDIVLPQGVKASHDVNFTVITVTGHKAEEEETPAEGEVVSED